MDTYSSQKNIIITFLLLRLFFLKLNLAAIVTPLPTEAIWAQVGLGTWGCMLTAPVEQLVSLTDGCLERSTSTRLRPRGFVTNTLSVTPFSSIPAFCLNPTHACITCDVTVNRVRAYRSLLLFKFRSFMQLICHMIQREFLAASTPSSWLFLDYRFVICFCQLLTLFCVLFLFMFLVSALVTSCQNKRHHILMS